MRRHRIITLFVFVIMISATIKFYLLTKNDYNYYGVHYFDGHRVQQNDSLFFANELLPLFSKDVKSKLDKEIYKLTYYRSSTQILLNKMDYWFPQLTPILHQYNIPDDFKYLVVIESGLKNVVSNKYAKGFWQFRRATAISNNLIVTKEIDQRYDPRASTMAACRYLKKLHRQLGSWVNVAAAYNMGLTGFKKQQRNQRKESYFQLDLNSETGTYVYKMMALKIVNTHRKKYKYRYSLPPSPPNYKELMIDSTISDIKYLANQYQITQDTVRKINPWILSNSITYPEKKYRILLPVHHE